MPQVGASRGYVCRYTKCDFSTSDIKKMAQHLRGEHATNSQRHERSQWLTMIAEQCEHRHRNPDVTAPATRPHCTLIDTLNDTCKIDKCPVWCPDRKVYFLSSKGEKNTGLAIVATSARQAKQRGWRDITELHLCDYPDIRVHLLEGYDDEATKKPVGYIFHSVEGVQLGIYHYAQDVWCPRCGERRDRVYLYDDGQLGCPECMEDVP